MHTLESLIKQYASQYLKQVVAWRRHIHSHPELSGEEQETSLYIQKILGELGIPYVNNVSDYAVIGEIQALLLRYGPILMHCQSMKLRDYHSPLKMKVLCTPVVMIVI